MNRGMKGKEMWAWFSYTRNSCSADQKQMNPDCVRTTDLKTRRW